MSRGRFSAGSTDTTHDGNCHSNHPALSALPRVAERRRGRAAQVRARRPVNPAWLAEEFVTTVLRGGEYDNAGQHFYGKRDAHKFAATLEATKDLVLRLEALPSVTPVDAGNRQIGGTGHPDVIDVPASDLAFEYVDRELLLQRTNTPAKWENDAINRGGIRPDILLADLETRTPIVAELKLPGDMDPFFALVQALAGTAHLATSAQYERMRNHLKRGKFPARSSCRSATRRPSSLQGPGDRETVAAGAADHASYSWDGSLPDFLAALDPGSQHDWVRDALDKPTSGPT